MRRALLDEIAEADAQRPSLGLIVQERRPRQLRVKAQLAEVWDYWAPDVAPDRNGAGGLRAG
jgi:acetolactate synthase regulatory subunit